MLRPRHLAGAVALALASSAVFAQSVPQPVPPSTHAGLFDNVVVFGDSLTDNGNLSLASGLPQIMRFTTNPGQTGIENVADYFGVPMTPALAGGTDFAFGGAGVINNSPGTPSSVPTLPSQLDMYLEATGNRADPNTLYAVWGGANDVFYAATSAGAAAQAQQLIQQTIQQQVQAAIAGGVIPNDPTAIAAFTAQVTPIVTQQVTAQVEAAAGVSTLMDQDQVTAYLQQAATTELGMIGQLGQAGARYVMVFNLPNIGLTPSGLAQGLGAAHRTVADLQQCVERGTRKSRRQHHPGEYLRAAQRAHRGSGSLRIYQRHGTCLHRRRRQLVRMPAGGNARRNGDLPAGHRKHVSVR
jgi:outer membrane lipase/esterase